MSKGVAIIGISGLYPEAADLNEFYRNLCRGLDIVRPLPAERVALSGCALSNDKRLLASIERIDEFDYEFFNFSPKEAEYTDPQQRWLLQLACAAIENAGYSLQDLRGSCTAVIVSASNNDYRRLFESGKVDPTAVTGNLPAALAGRIAYTLDLRGPALVINTACSSSLVAVTEAYRKVLSGEVDYALAGGINFFFLEDALGATDIGIIAPDGKAKAFDDSANGTGFGEGGGIALLKRLEDALADGDHIHAVIRGGAVDHDGSLSNGLTAPSPQAQTAVILRAWQEADITPEALQYIEAHGTGTKLGDPIEIQGLTDAFRKFTDRKQFCYLGSVKTNIGHLVSAAGITGLTKCVLGLRHKKIFPSLHFNRPNALINFAASPVVVNTKLREWEPVDAQTPRRCGVSSFGLSGTNAHLVLEEAPTPPCRTPKTQSPAEELITLSAKTPAALARYIENLRRHLEASAVALTDLAYTLNVGRDAYSCRFACVVRSTEELVVRLQEASVQGEKGDWHTVVDKQMPVVFLFSGDAAPEQSVCEDLARDFGVFAERYQQCLAQIGSRAVNRAAALFNFQFPLYHLWRSCHLKTDKLIGAGAGNKAVAVLTGRLSFEQGVEEALRLNDYAPLDHTRLKAVIAQIAKPYPPLFLEMGACGSLTHAVRSLSTDATKFAVIPSLMDKTGGGLWPAVAELYLHGAGFTMKPLYAGQMRRRVELPTYPFEKKRCWAPVPVRHAPADLGHKEAVAEPVSARSAAVLLDGDGAKTEECLARIWGDVLKVYELKRDDDYFELGGDSLSGTQLTNAIAEEFGVTLDFEDVYTYSTIRSLGERIEAFSKVGELHSTSDALRLVTVARTEPMPASSGQRRLWFLDQLEPENPFYNIPLSLRLKGPLETALLERCLREIVNRHEVLRTIFVAVEGRPGQLIKPSAPVSVSLLDLWRLSPGEREVEALRIAREDARRPFVLSEGPLIRVTLLRLGAADHLLQLTMHHIVSDGWSIALLVREFVELYRAYKTGRAPSLPELRVQYADYAYWQQQWLESAECAEQLAYWSRKLDGPLPMLELPTDRARPAVPSYRGARHDFLLPRELAVKLRALGQRENVTLFMVLLSAFQALLGRYTGQDDISVGSPIAGRNRKEIENLIGFFTNTLVFRGDLSGDPNFLTLFQRARQTALEAYAHQDAPFEKLVDELQPARSLNRTPLFQVMFVLQNISMHAGHLPEIEMQVSEPDRETAKFDVTLFMMEREDGLAGRLEYSADIFEAPTIERMVGHLLVMLNGIVIDPACKLSALPILPAAEQRQLASWSQTSRMEREETTLHRMFERQVALHPDRPAIIAEDQNLTFAELNERANQLAHYLCTEGVEPEARVALLVDRSSVSIISVLAILKAGGAYVPIDPNYPSERIAFILNDAKAKFLLVGRAKIDASRAQGVKEVDLDREAPALRLQRSVNPTVEINGANLAYVIYTSGTTGRPKGVMIQHQSAVNLFHALDRAIYSSESRPMRVGVNASLTFDASVKQIIQLLAGRTLCLIPEEIRTDREELTAHLNRHQVDCIDCTPALAKLLWRANGRAEHLYPKMALVGGEAIDEATWLELAAQGDVIYYNVYGPTECTVDATQCRIQTSQRRPVIGRPLDNVQVYALDRQLQPVPIGACGELFIAGDGLARGYLNHPALTAQRFIPHPFSSTPGARLYRSGDLVRFLPDGQLQFIGRTDGQIKLRGQRIELGEIESLLKGHPQAREAVVAGARGENGVVERLVGYVVRRESEDGEEVQWKEYLSERLPEAMRPWVVREVEEIPLTGHGKVWREKVEEWARGEVAEGIGAGRASGKDEEEMVKVWEEVLGVRGIGVHDNFFDLGGDSILSIQIVAKANQRGLSLKPRDLFQHQTIAELAKVARTGAVVDAEQGIVTGPVTLTPIQCWFFEQELPQPQHWNQAVMLEIRRRLNPDLLRRVVVAISQHHDALRLRFTRHEGVWRQTNEAYGEEEAAFSFDDLSGLFIAERRDELERRAAQMQSSLDLAHGPLWRVALFDCGPESPQRLLLVAHHLVVDGVSWRILLEDLQKGYEQLERGAAISFGRKTTSFKRWAEELRRYAQSPEIEAELPYWENTLSCSSRALMTDFPAGENGERWTQSALLCLSKEETHDLLHKAPANSGSQIQELLLTALAQSWGQDGQRDGLLLAVEGHGREHICGAVDISRTVGWFTAIYPVWLETRPQPPEQALYSVQKTLRQIPRQGMGFGLLRYLGPESESQARLRKHPLPEISFNYLGQFDQVLAHDDWFALATESVGPMHSPHGQRPYTLEIGAGVSGSTLQLVCRYSERVYRRESIEGLGNLWAAEIRKLIIHYCAEGQPNATLADLTDEQLTAEDLAKIFAQIGEV